jgi:hypothetical protein
MKLPVLLGFAPFVTIIGLFVIFLQMYRKKNYHCYCIFPAFISFRSVAFRIKDRYNSMICWIPAFYSLTYGRHLLHMTGIVSFIEDKTNKKKFSYSPATSAALPLDANQLLGETDDLRLVEFYKPPNSESNI